jgi:hypothetical protein
MARFASYGVTSERLGGLARSRSAMRDSKGRFLPSYGFFKFEDVQLRFAFAVSGYSKAFYFDTLFWRGSLCLFTLSDFIDSSLVWTKKRQEALSGCPVCVSQCSLIG